MDRRTALACLFATCAAAACGGGGGGDASTLAAAPPPAPPPAPTPAPAPSPAPAPATPLSADIAMWGDSLTPPVAANLQLLVPGRTVFNGGVTGETSTQIAARKLADGSAHAAWISVFWYGQNNARDPQQIKADLAASVASLAAGNDHFLVLGVINQDIPSQVAGGAVYPLITQLNAELAQLYPRNFFDMRSYLVSQGVAMQDTADLQKDVVPAALRFDEIHLDNDGSVLVARKLKELLDARGW